MKHLDLLDLKSCRPLNRVTASEAEPYLFSTIRPGPVLYSFDRATDFMNHRVAKYIRNVDFQGLVLNDPEHLQRINIDVSGGL